MIYIFNCNWVATQWQLFSTHVHTNNTGNITKQRIHRTTQKYIEEQNNYTQTIQGTSQNKEYIEQHKNT